MSGEEILTVLQSEGYTIQDWKLKQIRKDMGLFRKVQGAENLEESNTQLRTAIAAELDHGQWKRIFLSTFTNSTNSSCTKSDVCAYEGTGSRWS